MPEIGSLLGARYIQKIEADENHGSKVKQAETIEVGKRREQASPDVSTSRRKTQYRKHVGL
jgi:hypothetical protein